MKLCNKQKESNPVPISKCIYCERFGQTLEESVPLRNEGLFEEVEKYVTNI